MDSQSIDILKGTITKRNGFARTNRFRIFIAPPEILLEGNNDNLRDMNILCDQCNFPGRQMQTFEANYTRQQIKVAQSFINEDVSFTFNLTNDYFIKKIFDNWTNLIIDRDTFKKNYDNVYKRDIEIFQMDNMGNDVYGIVLKNAFPISIQSIELNNSEGQITQVTVEVTYEDFQERPISATSNVGVDDISSQLPFGLV